MESEEKLYNTATNQKQKLWNKRAEPNRSQMHVALRRILKEVDFNTTTLSDILRKLEAQYTMSLSQRKAELKSIIEEVIGNMTDEEDDGCDEEAVNGSD